MASQVPREFVIGNFKPTKSQRHKAKKARPAERRERREGNSDQHRKLIQTLPCCVPGCGVVGCHPHHLKHGPAAEERGTGMKATDRWLVPLCSFHHMYGVEIDGRTKRTEAKWFRDHGVTEPIELAASLFAASPDRGRMVRIVLTLKSNSKLSAPGLK